MTVAGVVMAHEKRRPWAEGLAEQLGLPICWDRINDRHETGFRCLEAGISSDASHWLVVQDDAITCRDLLAGLDQAVRVSEDRIVGLYVGNVRPQAATSTRKVAAAREQGRSWLALPGPWWGVGIVIPTVHLSSLVGHYEASRHENYDRRIEKWAAAAKVGCWYTVPSLVEHRHGDENPSLVPKRTATQRRARWFIGADESALDVDWTLTPPPPLTFRDIRNGRTTTAEPGSSRARTLSRSPRWQQVDEVAVPA